MLVVLAVASTVPHPDLALERIAPPPGQRSDTMVFLILLNT